MQLEAMACMRRSMHVLNGSVSKLLRALVIAALVLMATPMEGVHGCSSQVIILNRSTPSLALHGDRPLPRLKDALLQCRGLSAVLPTLGSVPRVVHVTMKTAIDPCASAVDTNAMIQLGLRSLLRHNPGWQLQVSDDAAVEAYLRQTLPANDWTRISSAHPVEKGDLWRMMKVFLEGGLYIDIDRLVNVNLNRLLEIQADSRGRGGSNGSAVAWLLPAFIDNGLGPPGQTTPRSSHDSHLRDKFVGFAQDFMLSAPGNPVFLLGVHMNIRRRHKCSDRRFQIERPVDPLKCDDVLYLGPISYTHAVGQCLTGRQVRWEGGKPAYTKIRSQSEQLHPLVKLVPDRPLFRTVLFDEAHADTNLLGASVGSDVRAADRSNSEAPKGYAWRAHVFRAHQSDKLKFYCQQGITVLWDNYNPCIPQ